MIPNKRAFAFEIDIGGQAENIQGCEIISLKESGKTVLQSWEKGRSSIKGAVAIRFG